MTHSPFPPGMKSGWSTGFSRLKPVLQRGRPFTWAVRGLLAVGLLPALSAGARGQQVMQYGFESRDPVWVPGAHDAAYKETAHQMTDEYCHGGQRAEVIRFQAEAGSFIHYTLDVGRAPVTEELNVSLWVKASRPGIQLLGRIVLPRERDPKNVDQPLTTLVRGEAYKLTGRWQPLTLPEPIKLLRGQQQLLAAELKRQVDTTDAYVDRIVLNVYGGPGQTEVYTDDLEVGPVLDARPPSAPGPARPNTPARPAVNRRPTVVALQRNNLVVDGRGFFLRMIRHTGTPLSALYRVGFNALCLDETTPPGLLDAAADKGFMIVPSLRPPPGPGGPVEGQLASRPAEAERTAAAETFARNVARFLDRDDVLCWDLGNNLKSEDCPGVISTARAFRDVDPMRLVSADVWDGLQGYAKNIDRLLLGVHRWPLLTTMELSAYRDWLVQRRRLASPDLFCWTWIQTHLPDWFLALAYQDTTAGGSSAIPVGLWSGRPAAAGAEREPMGPHPEQIRLMAYTAVGSGYRGLGFWSDRFLADSHTGRDRLLALAQLNQEFQMLEPLLVAAKGEPEWIGTSHPEVKAAVIRTDRAILVLPIWFGAGAQFVPGQGAVAELTLTVPQVPATCQAWEVSPGGLRSYRAERETGGMKVSLHNFSLTTALLFTADLDLVVRLQAQQRRMGGPAAQYARDQAAEEIAKAAQVDAELVKLGYPLPDGASLLARAREWLERCEGHRRNGEHPEAYADAQNALRAIRILMRAHWEQAVRDLSSPVASPYAVSFFTLPRHYQFRDQILHLQAGRNVLPHGDFELPPDQVPPGWSVQEVPSLDKVIPLARRVDKTTVKPHEGRQCLMLKITPQDSMVPPLALERTFLAIHSPEVRLEPGTIVRISTWVLIPAGVSTSGDGAMFYDSAGGEPLAVRMTGVLPRWQRVTLYRQVPASGTIHVTVALTGFGTAYFDDIRIEPLGAEGATESGTARGGTGAVIQAGARGEPSPTRWTTPAQAPTAGDRFETLRAGSRGRFPGE